jgi:4-hydroxy-tetrahydrodipicolinate reductase
MTDIIRVIQYGLGPIGSATARLVDERDNLELVGAVDIDPTKIGQDVGELTGLDRTLGIETRGMLAEVGVEADVVVHMTRRPGWTKLRRRPERPCLVPASIPAF